MDFAFIAAQAQNLQANDKTLVARGSLARTYPRCAETCIDSIAGDTQVVGSRVTYLFHTGVGTFGAGQAIMSLQMTGQQVVNAHRKVVSQEHSIICYHGLILERCIEARTPIVSARRVKSYAP